MNEYAQLLQLAAEATSTAANLIECAHGRHERLADGYVLSKMSQVVNDARRKLAALAQEAASQSREKS